MNDHLQLPDNMHLHGTLAISAKRLSIKIGLCVSQGMTA